MTSTSRLGLAVAATCVVVRLLVLVVGSGTLEEKVVLAIPDGTEYRALAGNLVHHRTFSIDTSPPYRPDFLRTPIYPLFLTPFWMAASSPLLPVVFLQIVLSCLLTWCILRLGLELELSSRAAVIAGLFCALSINLAFLTTKLVTETLFTLLLAVCLLLVNRFRRRLMIRHLVAAGACCGLLILTRPIALGLPILILAWTLFVLVRNTPHRWPVAFVVPATSLLMILPWAMRNTSHTGRFFISTAGEVNLVLYNAAAVIAADNSQTLSEARERMRSEAGVSPELVTQDPTEYWRRLAPVARQHLIRRPLTTLGVAASGFGLSLIMPVSIRPLLVHCGVSDASPTFATQGAGALLSRGRLRSAMTALWQARLSRLGAAGITVLLLAAVFHALLLALAALGIAATGLRRHLWLLLPVAYFLLLTGALGDARFRAPVEPLLCLFAAAFAGRKKDREHERCPRS